MTLRKADELNAAADAAAGLPNRRTFNTSLLMAGLAGVIGAPKPALSATRGGILRVATHTQSTNDTFDPAKFLYSNDYIRGTSLYNSLTALDEKGRANPELAESFESNATATRWIFKIRKGVTFHDGTPLAMEDIIFSILRHKDEKLASSAKTLVANIKEVKADGPDTLAVELLTPDVDLPILIGTFQFLVLKAGTTDFSKPMGTGPFTVKSFKPGVGTSFIRNPNYWKDGRPYVDEIEMFHVVDAVARANALLSGDAHLVTELRGTAIDQVANSKTHDVFTTPCSRYTSIQGRLDQSPSSDTNIGMALSYLMDRQRYLDVVLKGRGVIGNDQPVVPSHPLYNADLPQRGIDHDKAKFHLAKSGIGITPLEIHVSDASPFSVEMGQLLQREAARVGLTIDLKREPADSYWNTIAGQRPFTAVSFNPRPTYSMQLSTAYKQNAIWNYSHLNNAELDRLVDATRSTPDLVERKQIYHRIQQIIYESGSIALPGFGSYVDGASKKVKGLVPIATGNLSGFNFPDRVWLEG